MEKQQKSKFNFIDSINKTIEGIKNSDAHEQPTMNEASNRRVEKITIGKDEANSNLGGLIDTSADAIIARNIKYREDEGAMMAEIIKRLEEGQMVIVDFTNSEIVQKMRQFDVLYGAIVALHGAFNVIDKNKDFIMFYGKDAKVADAQS